MRWSGSLREQIVKEFREASRLRYGFVPSDDPAPVVRRAAATTVSARRIVARRAA